ncbi:MAG: hypothetical protein AAGD06_21675 [Acidobacteriota bacterium]
MRPSELAGRLLSRPESVTDEGLGELSAAIEAQTTDSGWRAACAAVAAAALQRPRSAPVAANLDRWGAALLNHPNADGGASRRLLEGLAARGQLGGLTEAAALGRNSSPFGAPALLGSVDHAIEMAARCVAWCPQRVTWTDLVRLARRVEGVFRAEAFLADVVERWLWLRPSFEGLDHGAGLRELEAALGAHPRWSRTRELARRRLRAADGATASLGPPTHAAPHPVDPPMRMVVVQNLDIGQGDEILRLGPLLAMLLTLAPKTDFDVVTGRRHLWDHPRLRPIAIDDGSAVAASLEAADGFAWTDEPVTPEIRKRNWLPAALQRRAAGASWVFEMVTRHSHTVFRQLRIGGVDRLPELGPHLPPRHAYDTLERLALLLGAPWIGEAGGGPGEAPGTAAPFIGRGSAEATAAAEELRGDPSRPLAVVQPFGGFAEVKGYTRGDGPRLVRELEALVAEGFEVVLLPTSEDWGSASVVRDLMGRLAPAVARHVRAAPDPAWAARLTERGGLGPADRIVRLFKYLISRADLVVAVEGWVCHLASLLGRPVRMVLWAGSFSPDWYPRDAAWAAGLSPGCAPRSLDPGDPSASVLCLTDRGLLDLARGGVESGEILESLVAKLFASEDPEIRAMALGAAARRLECEALADVAVRGLGDPGPGVRAAAAEAWLSRPDLVGRWPAAPATLRAHRWIAAEQWSRLVPLGAAALPALAVAAGGERNFIRRQAKRLLGSMLRDRAGARRGDGSPPGAL